MSFNPVIGQTICDPCGRCKTRSDTFVEAYWAMGNRHYCDKCWPRYRDYYEDEGGRQAWKRVGNYYAPIE